MQPQSPQHTPDPNARHTRAAFAVCALLDMTTFDGGSFYANGSAMASMTTASETTDMIASLRTASANNKAEIQRQASTIDELETINIQLEADLKNAEADNDKMPVWAIAIIAVLGAVLVLVIVTLAVVVSR